MQEGAQIILNKYSSYVSSIGVTHLDQLGLEHYYNSHSLNFFDPREFHTHKQNWKNLEVSEASISYEEISTSNKN